MNPNNSRTRSVLARLLLGRPAQQTRWALPTPQGPDELGLGPPAIEIGTGHLDFGTGVCASLAVTGYPREVAPGWLEPLLTHPGRVDVSLHVEPVDPQVAADRLRRQLARLEAAQRADHEHGRLTDFAGEAAAEDAYELAGRLARGQGRLFRVGLYLTVHAADQAELADQVARVRAVAAALLIDAKPTTFRALAGWTTTLPLGIDAVRLRRTFDTSALAAAFPFTSPYLTAPLGAHTVLYGLNPASASLVLWDRFSQDNHNSVVLATSGAGKSYFTKLETLRTLYTGVQVHIVDPEDEYARLTAAVGGAHLRLGAPGVRLNPFDLPRTPAVEGDAQQHGQQHRQQDGRLGEVQDALTRRALFIHTLTAVLLDRPLTPAERAALDRAIVAAYHSVGITADPRTWARPAPLLKDLAAALQADTKTGSRTANTADSRAAAELAAGLAPYVTGSWRGLFDGPTTTRPEGHLITFSLRDLPDELKSVGTLLALDSIWRQITDPVTNPAERRPRLVVVDEGWLLMRQTDGARFLFRLAKSSRKHWAGLTVVTQDAADVLGSELGRAVVSNAATQILLRQAPQVLDQISDAFALSEGERGHLAGAARGTALLVAGPGQRVAFEVAASAAEHQLVTSDPAELAGFADLGGLGGLGLDTDDEELEP